MKERGIYLAVLFFFAILLVGAREESPKIGYVDLQKVLMESDTGKQARGELERQQKESQQKLKDMEDSLKKMKDELDKQKAILSPEAYQKKEDEFNQKKDEFLKTFKSLDIELQHQDVQMTKDILGDLIKIVEKMGQDRNYTVILEKTQSSILYAPDSLDLTPLVLEAFNRQKQTKTQ
jgi:outer membrane protein